MDQLEKFRLDRYYKAQRMLDRLVRAWFATEDAHRKRKLERRIEQVRRYRNLLNW